MSMLDQAINYATAAHFGQVRKGPSRRPYITHPLDVVERLKSAGVTDEHILCAAAMHDVIEDTGKTYGHLSGAGFPMEVVELVWELTDPPGADKGTAIARQLWLATTRRYSVGAAIVKLADKASNLDDIVDNPPGWKRSAEVAYAETSARVVGAIGPINSELWARFFAARDRVAARTP